MATEQDGEFKNALNQIIKMFNSQEKATLAAGAVLDKTHLIVDEGEPFFREIHFEHYGRTYPDDNGVCFDESTLEIEEVNAELVEKDGQKSYEQKVVEVEGLCMKREA